MSDEATVKNEDQEGHCLWLGCSNTVGLENSLDVPHRKAGSLVLPFSCWLFSKGALGQDRFEQHV